MASVFGNDLCNRKLAPMFKKIIFKSSHLNGYSLESVLCSLVFRQHANNQWSNNIEPSKLVQGARGSVVTLHIYVIYCEPYSICQ